MKSCEGIGKSIEKAIDNALERLNAKREDVDIKILEEGGLFKKAKVLVTISEDCEEEYEKRAKEIEDAYKAIVDAKQHYNKLLKSFVKDYGSYHYSVTSTDPDSGFIFPDLNLDLIDKLFNAIF